MKIKKLYVLIITLLLILLNSTITLANTEKLDLTAKASILIDNRTKKILYSENADEKMYPASTTKILTAILAIEHCNLDDVVTASYDAITSIPAGYETASLQIGEKLTVEQLIQILLVHSANDAANVLAEYVGGSVDSFSAMMNTKANELGLSNSHFTNAYGKHDDNHYTTARDLATILQYCLKNESFRKLAGSASCAIPATNKYGTRSYSSTNQLLVSGSNYYYPYLTVGKTGYTSQAKGCLVSAAYKNDLELICVVLGCNTSSPNRFTDSKTLYEYAYNNYSIKNIAHQNDIITQIKVTNGTKDTKNLDLLINEDIPALIKNSETNNEFSPEITLNEKISAPIEEGTILGKVKYSIDGVEYTTNLIASHNVEKSKILTYILYTVGILILIRIIYLILFHNKNKKYINKKKKKKTKSKYKYRY